MQKENPSDTFQQLIHWFRTAIDSGGGLEFIAAHPELLSGRTAHTEESALHFVRIENEVEACLALLESGAEIDSRDHAGNTPLLSAVQLAYVELVELLLLRGADIKSQNKGGESVLHLWVSRPDKLLLQKLIDSGAELEVRDFMGATPLAHAKSMLEASSLPPVSGLPSLSTIMKQRGVDDSIIRQLEQLPKVERNYGLAYELLLEAGANPDHSI